MYLRKLTKLNRIVYNVIIYATTYFLISCLLARESTVTFVSDDMRIGDKYVLLFLVAPKTPVFTDVEGENMFKSRRCGQCFMTNNRGFLPMSEYDGILVYSDKNLIPKAVALSSKPGDSGQMVPDKYIIETDYNCIRSKFKKCVMEPKITSSSTNKSYDLCGLCDEMLKRRSLI